MLCKCSMTYKYSVNNFCSRPHRIEWLAYIENRKNKLVLLNFKVDQ